MFGLVGPDVRAFRRRRMSRLGGRMSRLERWHLLLSGSEGPDFRAGGRMSGSSGGAGCPGCRGQMSGACSLLRLGCCRGSRSRGWMSGAWEMLLAPSVGSPHPWTWGLVRLHAHLREDPLGT